MPKARGPDVDEALLEMERDKWEMEMDSGEWEYTALWNYAADYVADDKGNVRPLKGRVTFDDDCDKVDPRLWDGLVKLLRSLPRDERSDDDIPPIV